MEQPGNVPASDGVPQVTDRRQREISSVVSNMSLVEIRTRVDQLRSRDWWLWGATILVLVLMAIAVFSFSLPAVEDHLFWLRLDIAVRGLFAMVLLFSAYCVYQQVRIKKLQQQLMEQMSDMAALEARAEMFHRLAILDPLTDLYNRRFADEHLPLELAQAEQQGYPLTLLMLDLDGIQLINERYSRAAGDAALKRIAAALRRSFRGSDLLVRMGGDDFMAILPGCGADAVPNAMARIGRIEIEVGAQKVPVSFSAGWAQYRYGETVEEFVAKVELALRADKGTRQAEEQIRKAEARMRQAEKMEAIGRLAGGVAHDFNNLLGVIVGYGDLLLGQCGTQEILRKNVEQICKAAERATLLTRQLLAFSRKQPMQPRFLELNSVIVDMKEMLQRVIGEDVELLTELPPGLDSVKADLGQLQQVLLNLAANARDAMPLGGKLTVKTSNVHLSGTEGLRAEAGDYVHLSVHDTGCGIDEDTQAHIFEPFFTTKDSAGGTGLGLATVYGIVKQSAGHIRVSSQVGKGSTFDIWLPAIAVPAEEVYSPPQSADLTDGQGTILLVEDEPCLRSLSRQFLETAGYSVLEAESGEVAMEVVARYPAPIHLLLTDVVMPRMNGRELAESLAVLRPRMKRVFMSGYTGSILSQQGMLEPETVILEKPFTRASLLAKVAQVLHPGKIAPRGRQGDATVTNPIAAAQNAGD